MAHRENESQGYNLKACWRTKSVTRTIEEVEILHKKYKKNCLLFVDGSWNIDPKFNEQFADEMIKRKFKLDWFAFMRADFILRDEKKGVMQKLIDSGLDSSIRRKNAH